MLIVVARYVVSEGHESTVARLLRTNAEASRAEPGCVEFSVYREIDDPRAFLLYERYTGEDAQKAIEQTDARFGKALSLASFEVPPPSIA